MYGVIWTYPWDLLDEGVDTALARIANEGGMKAVSLSHSYHNVKHLRPHNPKRKLFVANSSAIYFQPDLDALRHHQAHRRPARPGRRRAAAHT